MKTHTIEQSLSGNAVIITIKPAKGQRLGSYASEKGQLMVVILKD